LKPIPKFESEDEEREFWATHDSTEYVDWSRAKPTTFSLGKGERRRLQTQG
jgi:hypothetical protein